MTATQAEPPASSEPAVPIAAQLGAEPGALIHIGQAPDAATRVSLI